MLQCPTGFGKTVVAAAITERIFSRGKKLLFTVPRIELIDQTVERFYAEGITEIGVIQASHYLTDFSKPIQIASVQTLQKKQILPEVDIAVVDEAHIKFQFYRRWFAEAKYPIIGMSATPWSKGLGILYDRLVVPTNIKDLISDGWLSPFKVFAPTLKPDLSAVKKTEQSLGRDYDAKDLSDVMSRRELVADVVDTWLKLGEGRSTLCFAVSRAHAKFLQEKFLGAGVSCGYVDCETPERERRALREDFASGALQIVCNVDVLCLDEQTEILTSDGFVGIDVMTDNHLIAAWDDMGIEFTRPEAVVRRQRLLNERMVSVEGKVHNIRVTANHRMLWSSYPWNFKTKQASDVVGLRGYIPVTGMAEPAVFKFQKPHLEHETKKLNALAYAYRKDGFEAGVARRLSAEHRSHINSNCLLKPPHEVLLDECALIGFWLGDGSRRNGRISLSQSMCYPIIVQWVDDLIGRLGLHVDRDIVAPVSNTNFESVMWHFSSGRGGLGQRVDGGVASLDDYLNKSGSVLFWGFDKEQFLSLMHGLWLADGNHGDGVVPSDRGTYITCGNLQLLELLQAIGACREVRITIRRLSQREAHHKPLYQMRWLEQTASCLMRERFQFETEYRSERVWCVTSTTGKIIIRRKGKVSVVGNSIGIDWDVRCMILARPTCSLMRHVQTVGRGLRTAEAKLDLRILDHGGSHLRLGMVTDIDITELDDGSIKQPAAKKLQAPPLPKECKECHAIVPAGEKTCPNCGYQWKLKPQPVRVVDGRLVEFAGDKSPRFPANRTWPTMQKAQFYGELMYYAQKKGYKNGWAGHKYRAKFGVYPVDPAIKNAPLKETTFETDRWIKREQIKYWRSLKRSY